MTPEGGVGGSGPPRPAGLFPRVVEREALLPRLSDAAMARVTVDVERLAAGRGALRTGDDGVRWMDPSGRLHVGVVQADGETRFRAVADPRAELAPGSATIGLLGVLAVGLVNGRSPWAVGAVACLATVGVLSLLRWHAGRVTARVGARLDALLDRLRAAAG